MSFGPPPEVEEQAVEPAVESQEPVQDDSTEASNVGQEDAQVEAQDAPPAPDPEPIVDFRIETHGPAVPTYPSQAHVAQGFIS